MKIRRKCSGMLTSICSPTSSTYYSTSTTLGTSFIGNSYQLDWSTASKTRIFPVLTSFLVSLLATLTYASRRRLI